MPSKRFVFLGQNTSPAIWAFPLLFLLEHVVGFGPCKAELAEMLWRASTGWKWSHYWLELHLSAECGRTARAPALLPTAAILFPG